MTDTPEDANPPGSRSPAGPAAARRGGILTRLDADGFVRVADLAAAFGVSEVTIRGDLDAIGRSHAVRRVHGGAVTVEGRPPEAPFEEALVSAADEKRRIGIAAAALVSSGDTVVLDVGTTSTAVAAALLDRAELEDIVIVTNGLTIALALERAIPRFTVLVTGGTLRPLQHSLVAPYATRMFEDVHADLAFIGCTGVDPEVGVTNVNLPESELKRRMVEAADRAVVVADARKLGLTDRGRVAPLSRFWALVTDGGDVDLDAYAASECRVVRA
jgi:DeoR family transcriptional regulator, aga operon transcriptional repressor